MKKYIYTILLSFFIISCGEQEVAQYDVVNGTSLVKFESGTSNLEVLIDSNGMVEIPISVSTFSESERTVTIEVVPVTNDDLKEAQPTQYSFNSSVVIPAQALSGKLILNGEDVGIEANETLALQLKVATVSFDNVTIKDEIHLVNIRQVCPIPSDYLVGRYMLSSPGANIWCSGSRPPFIGNGIEVEVSIGNSPSERVFRARYAPGSCDGFNGPYDFRISLSCGRAFLGTPVTTGVSCDGGATPIVIVDDPDRPTTYDLSDDSSIMISLIEDLNGSCASFGAPFKNTGFTLTKI